MLGDLGKLIVAKGFKKLPKVQKNARSGHTGRQLQQNNQPGQYEHSILSRCLWANHTTRQSIKFQHKNK